MVEIRDNLIDRIAEAEREGWLGDIEGLEVSLAGAKDKLAQLDASSVGLLWVAPIAAGLLADAFGPVAAVAVGGGALAALAGWVQCAKALHSLDEDRADPIRGSRKPG